MQRLTASLESAPIVWKDGYPYFVHPVTDGVPRLEGEVLSAIVHLIGERVDWGGVDLDPRHRGDGAAADRSFVRPT